MVARRVGGGSLKQALKLVRRAVGAGSKGAILFIFLYEQRRRQNLNLGPDFPRRVCVSSRNLPRIQMLSHKRRE